MPMRPWRPATGTGLAPAERGGHRFRGPETLPPWPWHVRWAQELHPEGITLHDIPVEAVFVQDASWYPNHTAGGGLVVADLVTGWHQTYRVPIPMHVDGS